MGWGAAMPGAPEPERDSNRWNHYRKAPHCEERSDEAIKATGTLLLLDRFAALAMTGTYE